MPERSSSARCSSSSRCLVSAHNCTRKKRSGSATSTFGFTIASSTLYMVVFSAMANPSENTAVAANAGWRTNDRLASRRSCRETLTRFKGRSFRAERLDGVDARGAERGDERGEERDDEEEGGHRGKEGG